MCQGTVFFDRSWDVFPKDQKLEAQILDKNHIFQIHSDIFKFRPFFFNLNVTWTSYAEVLDILDAGGDRVRLLKIRNPHAKALPWPCVPCGQQKN